jgi:hypothetical protein
MTNESYHTAEDVQKAVGVLRRSLSSTSPTVRVQAAGFFVLAELARPRIEPEAFAGDEARLIVSDLRHAKAVEDWRRVGDVIRHLEIRIDEEPAP